MNKHHWKVVDDAATGLDGTTYVYLEGTTIKGTVSEEGALGAEGGTGVWQGTVADDKTAFYFSKEKAVEAVKELILSPRSAASS